VEEHSVTLVQLLLLLPGTTGGTFLALPAGLVIDPATGVIDLGASAPNTYDITYSFGTAPCTGTATSQVTISNNPTATVSGGAFCATGTTTLTTTGATGGTFSATPAGLVIDPATGVIDLAASTPNTYDHSLTALEQRHVRNCYFAGDCISATNSNSKWRNIL
jgi:predicted outer membrane repeat protein